MKLETDNVQKFLDACYNSGIKRPELFIISKMPQLFGWLKGAFPRGILPTDVDGEVEIQGHFLRMEFKHEDALRSGRIPKGQHMAMRRLINTGKFTVMIIGTDDKGKPTCYELWAKQKTIPLVDCDESALFARCKSWAKWADEQKL